MIQPSEIAERLMAIWRRPFKEGDRYVIVQAAEIILKLADENAKLRAEVSRASYHCD